MRKNLLETTFLSSIFRANHKKSNGDKDSGCSMIEMLGVLTIIGVLTALEVNGYNHAIDKKTANATLKESHIVVELQIRGVPMNYIKRFLIRKIYLTRLILKLFLLQPLVEILFIANTHRKNN